MKKKVSGVMKGRLRLKKPKKTRCTAINRGLIIKEIQKHAVIGKGKKKVVFKISPGFIDEYISRILDGICVNIPVICESVYQNGRGRKTLMVKFDKKAGEYLYNDVSRFFDRVDSNTVSERGIS